MPAEDLAAAGTRCNPATMRHPDPRAVVAALGPGPNLQTLLLPHLIVTMADADQRVGNLMQDGIENLCLSVKVHEVDRERYDAWLARKSSAKSRTAAAVVEAEFPTAKAVLEHEGEGLVASPERFRAQDGTLHCALLRVPLFRMERGGGEEDCRCRPASIR